MNITLSELSQTCLATGVMHLLFVPGGYVLGWALNLMRFRSRSASEQLVWSVSFSLPIAIFMANIPGRYLRPNLTLGTLLLLDVTALALLLPKWRVISQIRFPEDRATRVVLAGLAIGITYIWLAGMPFRMGTRLFEPVFSSDWEIRLPLVSAAIRDGVPPQNPFFTFRGQSPPMRYYYYWYSVCAQVGRLVHTDSRSLLVASSVYSFLCITATLFLCVKYMLGSERELRKRCAILLGLFCVLGLDVIPSILGYFVWYVRVHPEIEWWARDRSPGLPGAIMFAPHHVAGIACGLLAMLLATGLGDGVPGWRKVGVHGCCIALAFASLVGTSSFIVMFFAFACTLVFLERLWRRDFRTPAALVLAAVLSVSVSVPYLREMTARTGVHGDTRARHSLGIKLRDNESAQYITWQVARRLHLQKPTGLIRFLFRSLLIPVLYLCETGFYLIVVIAQFRHDFLSKRRLSPGSTALWLLATATAVFGYFVTSAPIQYVNDLGVHAGLLLRLIYTLWGVEVVSRYRVERHTRTWSASERWTIHLAKSFLVLGVVMFVWQVTVDRFYLVLVDRHVIPNAPPFPQSHHLAMMYADVYDAQHALSHLVGRDAVIQSNPGSRYQLIFRLYQVRKQAAGDMSCEGAFGGDPELCHTFAPEILRLYGGHTHEPPEFRSYRPEAANMTLAAMTRLCEQVGISALLASRGDPAWYFPESWVWQGQALYTNRNVRAIRCPGA